MKPFKRNVYRLQTIERFVRGSDAAFCQIASTNLLRPFVSIIITL